MQFRTSKKKFFTFSLLFLLLIVSVQARNYGTGRYGMGLYGQGEEEPVAAAEEKKAPFAGGVEAGKGAMTSTRVGDATLKVQAGTTLRTVLISRKVFDKAILPFMLKDQSKHSIIVESADAKTQTAIATISSKPITVKFEVNKTQKFDLNENFFYDLSVTLEKVLDSEKGGVFLIEALDENERATRKPKTISFTKEEIEEYEIEEELEEPGIAVEGGSPKIEKKNLLSKVKDYLSSRFKLIKNKLSSAKEKVFSYIEINPKGNLLTGQSFVELDSISFEFKNKLSLATDKIKKNALSISILFFSITLSLIIVKTRKKIVKATRRTYESTKKEGYKLLPRYKEEVQLIKKKKEIIKNLKDIYKL